MRDEASSLPAVAAELDRRAEKRTTSDDRGRLVWRRWGAGPLVILLHGGSGSWTHWLRNIEALARDHEVWACDLPGHGESDAPPEPVGFEPLALQLKSAIAQIAGPGRRYAAAGFSFGCFLGQYLSRIDESLAGLLLANGHFVGFPANAPQQLLKRWRNVEDEDEQREILRGNLNAMMLAQRDSIDDETVELYRADLLRSRLRIGDFFHTLDRNLIETVRTPMLIVSGALDPIPGPSAAAHHDMIRKMHPDAELHLVEGAGHWVPYEAAETFNALALDWLARIPQLR